MGAPNNDLPLDEREEIDRLADQFERAFRAGENPRIEEYLQQHPRLHQHLLRELLALEVELRRARGDQFSDKEYRQQFPEDEEIVAAVMSAGLAETVDMAHEQKRDEPERLISQHLFSGTAVLGRYKLRQVLGRGAFGVVYLAHDNQLDRAVALKVARQTRFEGKAQVANFIDEARKAANLKHPSLVSVYDIREEQGVPFIVQEFVDGKDLAAIIDAEGPLPMEAAARVILDVATGLAHAHAQGIQHLDVKPQNILICRSGKAMLSDFGLALHDDEKWTSGSRGTLAYMAPEQLKGDAPQFDGRTDIWGLGVVLYEMLTKHRPFDGGSSETWRDNLVHAILHVQPKPPSQWEPGLDSTFDRICLQCLSKSIENRYKSATELIGEIRAVLDATQHREAVQDEMVVPDDISGRRRSFIANGCLVLAVVATSIILVALGVSPRHFDDVLDWVKRFVFGRR